MKEPIIKQEWVDQRLEDLRDRLMFIKEQEAGRGVRAKEQAEKTGLGESNLTKYTKTKTAYIDKRKKPPVMGVDKLIRICQYYDVSADYMLGLTSDSKLMRRSTPNEAVIKQMCEYTGLSREVVAYLHEKKNDTLFRAGITYLIAEKKNLLSNIIDYILSGLHDIVAEDERYSLLPGVSSLSEERKHFFYDVIEELPQAREHFYHRVTTDEKLRVRYARELAMKHVDHEKVFNELYPNLLYREDLTPEECAKLDWEINQELYPREINLKLSPDNESEIEEMYSNYIEQNYEQFPAEKKCSIDDLDDLQALYENQCESFWKEYYSRIKK